MAASFWFTLHVQLQSSHAMFSACYESFPIDSGQGTTSSVRVRNGLIVLESISWNKFSQSSFIIFLSTKRPPPQTDMYITTQCLRARNLGAAAAPPQLSLKPYVYTQFCWTLLEMAVVWMLPASLLVSLVDFPWLLNTNRVSLIKQNITQTIYRCHWLIVM